MTTILLAADRAESAIASLTDKPLRHCYEPFGHGHDRSPGSPAFNGVYQESITLHYLLGNGYRAYSPLLRRFLSPDSLSPFRNGGLNSYAYCKSDPINATDPTGHMLKFAPKLTGFTKRQNSYRKNMAFTDIYIKIPRSEPRLSEMVNPDGRIDSNSLYDFLRHRENVARAGLANLVDNYHIHDRISTDPTYRRELIKNAVNAERMQQAFKPYSRESHVLVASNIALNDNDPLQAEAKLFVSRTVGRQYEDISPATHLRMREIMQRGARRTIGKDVINAPWYKESIRSNSRLRQMVYLRQMV